MTQIVITRRPTEQDIQQCMAHTTAQLHYSATNYNVRATLNERTAKIAILTGFTCGVKNQQRHFK